MEKKKVGRPARAKGEKMERLSVVIQKRYRDALELIARDRQTSLSQAIEYVIAVVARDYKIEDETVKDIIAGEDTVEKIIWAFLPQSKTEKEESKLQLNLLVDQIIDTVAHSKWIDLLNVPESVRTPEEKYMVSLFEQFGNEIRASRLDDFFDFVSQEYRSGTPIEELEKKFSETINANKMLQPLNVVGSRAMLKPLEVLEGIPEPKPASKGPVPRKRFPKK